MTGPRITHESGYWKEYHRSLIDAQRKGDTTESPKPFIISGMTSRGAKIQIKVRVESSVGELRAYFITTDFHEKLLGMSVEICRTTNIGYIIGDSLIHASLPGKYRNKGIIEATAAHALDFAFKHGAKIVYTYDFNKARARAIKLALGGSLLTQEEYPSKYKVELLPENTERASRHLLREPSEKKTIPVMPVRL